MSSARPERVEGVVEAGVNAGLVACRKAFARKSQGHDLDNRICARHAMRGSVRGKLHIVCGMPGIIGVVVVEICEIGHAAAAHRNACTAVYTLTSKHAGARVARAVCVVHLTVPHSRHTQRRVNAERKRGYRPGRAAAVCHCVVCGGRPVGDRIHQFRYPDHFQVVSAHVEHV